MTREEVIENLKELLKSSYIDSFEDTENEALEIAICATDRDIKIRKILERDCTDITKFVLIRDLYNKEVINEK